MSTIDEFAEEIAEEHENDDQWTPLREIGYSMKAFVAFLSRVLGFSEKEEWLMNEDEFKEKVMKLKNFRAISIEELAIRGKHLTENAYDSEDVTLFDVEAETPTRLLTWVYRKINGKAARSSITAPIDRLARDMYSKLDAKGMWDPNGYAIRNLKLRKDLDNTFYRSYEGFKERVGMMLPRASDVTVLVYTFTLLFLTEKRCMEDSDENSSDPEKAAPMHVDGIPQMMQQIGSTVCHQSSNALIAMADEYIAALFDHPGDPNVTTEERESVLSKLKNLYRGIHAKVTFGMCLAEEEHEGETAEYNATRRQNVERFESYLPQIDPGTFRGGDRARLRSTIVGLIEEGYDANGPKPGTDSTETSWVGMMIQAGKTVILGIMMMLNGARYDQNLILLFFRDKGGKDSSKQFNDCDRRTLRNIFTELRNTVESAFTGNLAAHLFATGKFWKEYAPHIAMFDKEVVHNEDKALTNLIDNNCATLKDKTKVHFMSFNSNGTHIPIISSPGFAKAITDNGINIGVGIDEVDTANTECHENYRESEEEDGNVTKLWYTLQMLMPVNSISGCTSTAVTWLNIQDYVNFVIAFPRRLHRSPENVPIVTPAMDAVGRSNIYGRVSVFMESILGYITGTQDTEGQYHDERPNSNLVIDGEKPVHSFLFRFAQSMRHTHRCNIAGLILSKICDAGLASCSVVIVMYDHCIKFRCTKDADSDVDAGYGFVEWLFNLLRLDKERQTEEHANLDGILPSNPQVQPHQVGEFKSKTLWKNMFDTVWSQNFNACIHQARGELPDPVMEYIEGRVSQEIAHQQIEDICEAATIECEVGVKEWWHIILRFAQVVRDDVIRPVVDIIEENIDDADYFGDHESVSSDEYAGALRNAMTAAQDESECGPIAKHIMNIVGAVNIENGNGKRKWQTELQEIRESCITSTPREEGTYILSKLTWRIVNRRYNIQDLLYPDTHKANRERVIKAMVACKEGESNCMADCVEAFKTVKNNEYASSQNFEVPRDIQNRLKDHCTYRISTAAASSCGLTISTLMFLLQFYALFVRNVKLNVFIIPNNNGFRAMTYNSNLPIPEDDERESRWNPIFKALKRDNPAVDRAVLRRMNHKTPLSGQVLDYIRTCMRSSIIQAMRVCGKTGTSRNLQCDHGVIFCESKDRDAIKMAVYYDDQVRTEVYANNCMPLGGIVDVKSQKTYGNKKSNNAHQKTVNRTVTSAREVERNFVDRKRKRGDTSFGDATDSPSASRRRHGESLHIDNMRNLPLLRDIVAYYFDNILIHNEKASSDHVATYLYNNNIFRSNTNANLDSRQQTTGTIGTCLFSCVESGYLCRERSTGVWRYWKNVHSQ